MMGTVLAGGDPWHFPPSHWLVMSRGYRVPISAPPSLLGAGGREGVGRAVTTGAVSPYFGSLPLLQGCK